MAKKASSKKKTSRGVADLPVDIISPHFTLGDGFMTYIDGRIRTRLRKFSRDILQVAVRFDDANGPKKGMDQLCRIQVSLRGLSDVVVTEQNDEPRKAFDLAVSKAEHSLHHHIGRVKQPRHRPAKPGRVLADLAPNT